MRSLPRLGSQHSFFGFDRSFEAMGPAGPRPGPATGGALGTLAETRTALLSPACSSMDSYPLTSKQLLSFLAQERAPGGSR